MQDQKIKSIDISRNFKNKQAVIRVREYGNYIFIHLIKVYKKYRYSGIGSNIIKQIVDYADTCNKIVILQATAILGSNFVRLVSFYKKFGFIFGSIDIKERHNMHYIPIKQQNLKIS